MSLQADNWNVIVAGRWNRAILTPQGIAARLFGLQPDTPIEIEVPLDSLGPYRVTHEGLTVVATGLHLVVEPRACVDSELKRAMDIAKAAVENLPETPLVAVGLNIRYRVDDPGEELLGLITQDWDKELSDQRFPIQGRSAGRSVAWHGGQINVAITEESGPLQVQFNVERRSQVLADHVAWLSRDIAEIREAIDQLLVRTMRVPSEDIPHE